MTAVVKCDGLGELRSAIDRRDLSGLDLGEDREGVYKYYLSRLPLDLLVTGATWIGVERWDKSLAGEHTLQICGVLWWSGHTEMHGQRWSLDVRRGVLHLFEAQRPEDIRPRNAIDARQRWVDSPTDQNRQALLEASAAAYAAADAAQEAVYDAAWGGAWSAAWSAAADAAWDAAWDAAASAASSAAWSAARNAAWGAERAKQEKSWLRFMIEEGR